MISAEALPPGVSDSFLSVPMGHGHPLNSERELCAGEGWACAAVWAALTAVALPKNCGQCPQARVTTAQKRRGSPQLNHPEGQKKVQMTLQRPGRGARLQNPTQATTPLPLPSSLWDKLPTTWLESLLKAGAVLPPAHRSLAPLTGRWKPAPSVRARLTPAKPQELVCENGEVGASPGHV